VQRQLDTSQGPGGWTSLVLVIVLFGGVAGYLLVRAVGASGESGFLFRGEALRLLFLAIFMLGATVLVLWFGVTNRLMRLRSDGLEWWGLSGWRLTPWSLIDRVDVTTMGLILYDAGGRKYTLPQVVYNSILDVEEFVRMHALSAKWTGIPRKTSGA